MSYKNITMMIIIIWNMKYEITIQVKEHACKTQNNEVNKEINSLHSEENNQIKIKKLKN